jgi:hypothetical protein
MKFKVYYRVSVNDRVRFESLFLDQAQEFARQVYRDEQIIADIDEIERADITSVDSSFVIGGVSQVDMLKIGSAVHGFAEEP